MFKNFRPESSIRCAGLLYQFYSKQDLPKGAFVAVNGPHDHYGAVLKSSQEADERFLILIRGVPRRVGERVAASF